MPAYGEEGWGGEGAGVYKGAFPAPPSRHPAAMAFNGTWKVDRSENYDKFMEQMGEWVELGWLNLVAFWW